MKVKEKKELLKLLSEGLYEDARNYILNCSKDHTSNRETSHERNLKWAMGNQEALRLLDIDVGQTSKTHISRGTMSCVATYAYPERRYRFITDKEDNNAVVVIRLR